MSATDSESDPLAELAEEFLSRYRQGERPDVSEYVARRPELETEIRDLFPALAMMEDVRPTPAAPPPPETSPPTRLGDYRLVREVGRGGMGIVYEAEQESLGRRVALKVLTPAALRDPRQVERFRREARAAARLHHTNIVPVFGVGEADGAHYYVMQYIEGQPLDQVLTELTRLRRAREAEGRPAPADDAGPDLAATEPDANTSGTSRLFGGSRRRFARNVALVGAQIADALDYAAKQGVLHRDIKPANLLLDVWGAVWVTDFGLAKATGHDDLTHTGDIIGTLRYMAPERFAGRADVRSDIYALGLTLYEMLALRPAFDAPDRPQLVQQVLHQPPPRLDALDPELPPDLVTVVHKAIATDPEDRYTTAAAAADDLRAFAQDRPIAARRTRWPERAWRWCRRNPVVAALSAAVLTLLLVGAVGSGAAAWRMAHLRRAAELQGEEAQRNAVEAQAVVDYLVNHLIAGADPEAKRGQSRSIDEVLDNADKTIDGRFPDQPLVEASIRFTMGLVHTRLFHFREAESHFRRAYDLRHEHLGPDHELTLLAEGRLGGVIRQGEKPRLDEARSYLGRAVAGLTRLRGDEDREVIRFRIGLTVVQLQQGDVDEVEESIPRLMETSRRALGPGEDETISVLLLLSQAHEHRGRWSEAHAAKVQMRDQFAEALGKDHPRRLYAESIVFESLQMLGRLDEAEVLGRALVADGDRVLGPDHLAPPSWRFRLGLVLLSLGKVDDARVVLEEAMRPPAKGQSPFRWWVEPSRIALAEVDQLQGRPEQAQARFEEARRWMARGIAVRQIDGLPFFASYGLALAFLGRHQEAVRVVEPATQQAGAPPNNLFVAARVHGLCRGAAARDERLTPAERDALARSYGARCLELLTRCRAAGYFRPECSRARLTRDAAFAGLRDDPEGKAFLRSVEE